MKTPIFKILFALSFLSSWGQAGTITQNQILAPKMDILFVIDNSGSMESPIRNLIQQMPTLLDQLKKASIDFHIGVTTTDAYLANYFRKPQHMLRLRDGREEIHSGVFVITPGTPNMDQVLSINLNQGTKGSGDERAFSSFREVLTYADNRDFRRPDAALSVLVLSDEDDFSHNDLAPENGGYYFTEDYNDPNMIPVQEFADFLRSIGDKNSATFSTISVLEQDCKEKIGTSDQKIGRRYLELANATQGYKGSLCEIKSALEQYSEFVIRQATCPFPGTEYVIKLDHKPLIETIVVKVNGRFIAPDSQNGWTYDATAVSLILHGRAIPKKGDLVSVSYDYED